MYDAVIIGAGIGGLVCGCYLAKAGMKVLIVEQHTRPGGYCTSFRRGKFLFDAGPHCFGSYREDGIMRRILDDLCAAQYLVIMRAEPSDVLIVQDRTAAFWNSTERTIDLFQKLFPHERDGLARFFYMLVNKSPVSYAGLRKATFSNVLNGFFSDASLKAMLGFPLLAVNGLPPSQISAFAGAKLYSEFILDGGYYPQGGMQELPNALVKRFGDHGGELRLSCAAHKIKVRTADSRVQGVFLSNGEFAETRTVISNIDARQTFFKLIGKDRIPLAFMNSVRGMVPSLSNFIVYLGTDGQVRSTHRPGTTVHMFSHEDVDYAYRAVMKGDFSGYGGFAYRISYDQTTIYAGMPAPFKAGSYWVKHKVTLQNDFIRRIQKYALPDLLSHIQYAESASPHTMQRYTANYRGAAYGWASIPEQVIVPGFRQPDFVKGLYLAGHWSTLGVGVSGAAYVGADTAGLILGKQRKKEDGKKSINLL